MSEDNTAKIIPKVATGGRPGVDWDYLFSLWSQSDKPKNKFLQEYGISTKSSTTIMATKHWTRDARIAHRKAIKAGLVDQSKLNTPDPIKDMWQVVQGWRRGQAANDFKVADNVRMHCKLLLQQRLKRDVGPNGQERFTSFFKPHELRSIAETLEKVQRIQRLALGMSTENVGVEVEEIEKKENNDGNGECPVFIVEVSETGKFKRSRPKQVN